MYLLPLTSLEIALWADYGQSDPIESTSVENSVHSTSAGMAERAEQHAAGVQQWRELAIARALARAIGDEA